MITVGTTKYEDEQRPSEGERGEGARTGGAEMPVLPKIVVVEFGSCVGVCLFLFLGPGTYLKKRRQEAA